MCIPLPHTLMILEVSQKQAYIFGSRKLKENVERSEQIRYVTSPEFFSLVCGDEFSREENLVYTGGGHTVLQFNSEEAACRVARRVTRAVLEGCPAIELFVRCIPYDPAKTAGENLLALSQALEEKKARRSAGFAPRELGFEQAVANDANLPGMEHPAAFVPQGWTLSNQTDDLTAADGSENFVAVVHIDGNAMGARVQNIYKTCTGWDECRAKLQQFSRGIDEDFNAAYEETAAALAAALDEAVAAGTLAEDALHRDKKTQAKILPLRRVVGAGDDVCFVTGGRWGLEAAALFLERLARRVNPADGAGYSACAGVAMVHTRYPFRVAYDLSEQLCSNAKRQGVQWDAAGSVCALDWHIEFGQLKGSLSMQRQDYFAEDGSLMTLRPVAVTALGSRMEQVPDLRSYRYLRKLMDALQSDKNAPVRSKLKALRTPMQQGEIETELAARRLQMTKALQDMGLNARDEVTKRSFYADDVAPDGTPVRRSLYFDAIEISDHVRLWKGGAQA